MPKGIYTLMWLNPYTNPPEKLPREIMEREGCPSEEKCPEMLARYMELGGPGSGWFMGWRALEKPRRTWSPEAKARNRRKRMEKRMWDKFPLFAEDLIRQELEARPAYFAGE